MAGGNCETTVLLHLIRKGGLGGVSVCVCDMRVHVSVGMCVCKIQFEARDSGEREREGRKGGREGKTVNETRTEREGMRDSKEIERKKERGGREGRKRGRD